MKNAKRIAALALVLALALTGCGAMEDVSRVLVQGNLDEIYLGQYNADFLELVGATEAEAEQDYIQGLEVEAQVFIYYFQIENVTDELTDEIVELYKEIYSHSRYEVGESSQLDDNTYGVQLTIYPIDIMQSVAGQIESASEELYAQTYETEDDFEAAWTDMILRLCRDNLDSIGYLDPVEMVVQVKRDDNNVWTIYEDDFQNIDAEMIYYP